MTETVEPSVIPKGIKDDWKEPEKVEPPKKEIRHGPATKRAPFGTFSES